MAVISSLNSLEKRYRQADVYRVTGGETWFYSGCGWFRIEIYGMGLWVVLDPQAVVRHQYEFSRNSLKFYLIERNRLLCLLTTYQTRTLVMLAPALLLVELAMLAQAVFGRWAIAKLKGYRWLIQNASHVCRRKKQIQQGRLRSDRDLQWLYFAGEH